MYHIAICDDNQEFCQALKNDLLKYAKQKNISIHVQQFFTPEEYFTYLNENEPADILFLDIELGKINGVTIGKEIRKDLKNEVTQIVYVSSKESYAMELFETQYLIADYDYETDKINWVRSVAVTAYAEQSLNPGSIIVKSGDSYDIVDKCYNGIRIADIKTGEEKLNLSLDSEKGWYDACYYNGTVYGAKDKGIYKYNTETKKWKKVCSLSSSDLKNLRASKKRPPSLHVINQKSFLLYGNKSIVEYDKKKLKVLRIDL